MVCLLANSFQKIKIVIKWALWKSTVLELVTCFGYYSYLLMLLPWTSVWLGCHSYFPLQQNTLSAMGVNEHTKKIFTELQRKKMHRYVIFKVDEKKREVVVEKIGSPAESYEDFTAVLPVNDCRYAVYDFDFVTSDNCQKSKIFFIAWLAFLLLC